MSASPSLRVRPDADTHPDPAVLVDRMASGDETALGALYDLAVPRVYGLALRICRNEQLAEEVTADVFYQCWKEAGRYRVERGKVTTWLLMMCRTRAIDALRARDMAIPHEAPEMLLADEEGSERDPQELFLFTEASAALHDALVALAPVQRQMIGLAFFRGLSHQEIAAYARVPIGTVKSHIRRGLELLRQSLEARAPVLKDSS
jgi:RNA polymerase sigma factor (sigma-70 family)